MELEVFDILQSFVLDLFFKHLDARLRAGRKACLGFETSNEYFGLPALLFFVKPGFFVYLFFLVYLGIEFIGPAFNFLCFAAVDRDGMGCHAVHEAPVVGNEYEFASPIPQELFEPADGDYIEVIASARQA